MDKLKKYKGQTTESKKNLNKKLNINKKESSKINLKNFVCPIWQIEGEKILHDRSKLFVHTKHAKMRIFNTPVYYFPYMIHPSPLRKERKSGFLNPSIATNFLSTKSSQSLSSPYFFVIADDK